MREDKRTQKKPITAHHHHKATDSRAFCPNRKVFSNLMLERRIDTVLIARSHFRTEVHTNFGRTACRLIQAGTRDPLISPLPELRSGLGRVTRVAKLSGNINS